MFNFRYNILALYQVGLGLLSSLLLVRVFGVSAKADVYLIATNIVTSLQMLQLMLVEQFMIFYNDLKVEDRHDALRFFQTAATFALLSGIVFSVAAFIGVSPLVKFFAYGLDPERSALLREILLIFLAGSALEPLNVINQRLLNAEQRFAAPYVIGSLQTLCTVVLLFCLLAVDSVAVELVAWARTCGSLVAVLAGLFVLWRLGFPLQFRLSHPSLRPFVRNSLSMRLGHNLHNFLFNPITNNILAALPGGQASCYYYAQRLQQIVANVAIGPGFAVLQSNISSCWSRREPEAIKRDVRRFLPRAVALFAGVSAACILLTPPALTMIGSRQLGREAIVTIQYLFLALTGWQLVILLEAPFVAVAAAAKKSRAFIVANSLFIAIYFLATTLLASSAGSFAIPAGAIAGQLVNITLYALFALTLLGAGRFAGGANVATGNPVARWVLK